MSAAPHNPKIAVVYTLSAMALFGVIDNFMRLAAETGGLWQFQLLRSLIALAVLFIVAAFLKIGLRPQRPLHVCLLYTSPSPRDKRQSRMPSSA